MPAKRDPEDLVLLVPLCASERSQSSGAISREAIWHGVLAGCDLWDEDLLEGVFTNGFTGPSRSP